MFLEKWISNKTQLPFYTRKKIEIKKNIKSAKVSVCGLGQFNLYINGNKVDDHIIDPGWTNYDKIVQYVDFDILKLLEKGINVIGIEVGNGWYLRDFSKGYVMHYPEFMPPVPNPYEPFGKYLCCSLTFEIQYEEGETEIITTDESWKVKEHFVTMSNVYGSEVQDGRKKQTGWSEKEFNEKYWENAYVLTEGEKPKGKPVPQLQPPITIKKVYDGIYSHDFNDSEIYDFGQNMAGMLFFEVKGKKGSCVEVFPAEKLDVYGNIDQMSKGWTLLDSVETYIIGEDDKWEKFSMKFTYFAGRYVAVRGASRTEKNNSAIIRNIKSSYITNSCEDSGNFICDDERYLKIYEMILRSVESNLMSVHTDCPQIERIAWQEINHLMAPSIMFIKNVKTLWEKIFLDIRYDQCTKEECYNDFFGGKFYPGEGLVPSQIPCYEHNVLPVPGIGSFYDIAPWGSAAILGPYWHYLYYGDVKVIEENYETGKKYLNHLISKVNEEGFINHGLGDWGIPLENANARENVETVFLYADALVLANFAGILGMEDDKEEFNKYALKVKENYNKKLLIKHPTEDFYCYKVWDHSEEFLFTQSCQALPLYWGMVPEEKEEDLKNALKYILEKDNSFVSGEIGLPYIIQSLNKFGMNDLICELILKEKHPSYYAFVLDGETTLGEYWETNPRSHNHDMLGHIIEWYYNGIGGIKPIEAGFSRIIIKPYIPKTMKNFTCVYNSVKGKIIVTINCKGENIEVFLNIPEDIEYEFDSEYLEKEGEKVKILKNENELNNKLESYVKANEVAGISLLVKKDGEVVYKNSTGFSDLENKIPVKEDTIFRLASMTKPIISIGIMQLIEKGKLSIETPITQFLPSYKNMLVAERLIGIDEMYAADPENPFSPKAAKILVKDMKYVPAIREITIKDILTHSSGMGHGPVSIGPAMGILLSPGSLQEKVEKFSEIPLDFQPGSNTGYSAAVGYDVLGRIIEIVSGMSLNDFINENITKPLGIKDLTFSLNEEQMSRLAKLYEFRDGYLNDVTLTDIPWKSVNPIPNNFFSGSAGLLGTLESYQAICEIFYNKGKVNGVRVVSEDSINLMNRILTDHNKNFFPGAVWGLGLLVFENPGLTGRSLEKGTYGWSGAYGTHFYIDEKNKISVVLMLNRSNIGGGDSYISKEIEELVYNKFVKNSLL